SGVASETLDAGLLRSEDLPASSTPSVRVVGPLNPDGSCSDALPETKASIAFELPNSANLAETVSLWRDAHCVMALVRRSLDAAVARSATDPRHREELQLGSLGEDSVVFAVPGPDYGDIVIIRRGDLVANIDLSQSTPPD